MHTGSCLCGAVKYRIDAPIESLTHCHCSRWRTAQGAAFATVANTRLDRFHILQGKAELGVYHSCAHVTRTFCRHCGSPLQFLDNREHAIGIAAGTLDTPLSPPPPQPHIFVGSKADWYQIRDDLPQHDSDRGA